MNNDFRYYAKSTLGMNNVIMLNYTCPPFGVMKNWGWGNKNQTHAILIICRFAFFNRNPSRVANAGH